jgi:type IV pilus assembly protein PilQ
MRLTSLVAVLLCALSVSPANAAKSSTTEKKITLDLQQAELTNVIRLLADVGNKNVIVADDVKGKVSLRLKNVGWRAALDIIVKSGGYGIVEEDNVLWVTSQERIDAEALRVLDQEAERALKGPLTTRMIPVNYGNAADMAALIRPMLSPRGKVSVDVRNNVVIVTDVAGAASLR